MGSLSYWQLKASDLLLILGVLVTPSKHLVKTNFLDARCKAEY